MTTIADYYDQSNQRYLIDLSAGTGVSDVIFGGSPVHQIKSLWITGASRQLLATRSLRYFQAAHQPSRIVPDGADLSAPADPSFTLNAMRVKGGIPEVLTRENCLATVYEILGSCGRLDDLYDDDTDYAIVYENSVHNGQSLADSSNQATASPLIDTENMLAERIYFAGKLSRQVVGNLSLLDTKQARGVVYYGNDECFNCDSVTGAAQWIAVLLHNGVDTDPAIVAYSIDGGQTWDTNTTLTGSIIYDQLLQWRNFLVVTHHGEENYTYIPINNDGTLATPIDVSKPVVEVNRQAYADNSGLVMVTTDREAVFVTNLITNDNYTSDLSVIAGSLPSAVTRAPSGRYIVGFDQNLAPDVSLAYSDDNGMSWQAVKVNPPAFVAGAAVTYITAHTNAIWDVMMDDDTLWRTTNSGTTWRILSSGNDYSDASMLALTPSLIVYAMATEVGESEMLYSLDAGSTIFPSTQGWRFGNLDVSGGSVIVVGVYTRGPAIAAPMTTKPDLRANRFAVAGATSPTSGYLHIYSAIKR